MKLPLIIFLSTLLIYLSFASGHLHTMDDHTNYYVTKALFENHHPAIEITLLERHLNTTIGSDGKQYSYYGLGAPLLFLPFYVVGRSAGKIFGYQHYLSQAGISIANAFFTALTASIIFLLLTKNEYKKWQAIAAVILYSFFSIAFVWSKYQYNSVIVGALFLTSHYLLYYQKKSFWLISGVLLGLAVNVRYDAVIGVCIILLFHLIKMRPRFTNIFFLAAGVIPFAFLILYYNHLRFDSFFKLGYTNLETASPFGTPLSTGIYGLLFSPNRGLLWYSPLFLLLPIALVKQFSKSQKEFIITILLSISYLIFFAKAETWDGGVCWGPRYLGCILPFLAVSMAELIREYNKFKNAVRVFAVLSLIVEIWGSTVTTDSYHDYLVESGVNPLRTAYEPALSPIFGISKVAANFNLQKISLSKNNDALAQGGHPETKILRNTPDYWPFYAYKIGTSSYIIFFIWLTLFSSGVYFTYKIIFEMIYDKRKEDVLQIK